MPSIVRLMRSCGDGGDRRCVDGRKTGLSTRFFWRSLVRSPMRVSRPSGVGSLSQPIRMVEALGDGRTHARTACAPAAVRQGCVYDYLDSRRGHHAFWRGDERSARCAVNLASGTEQQIVTTSLRWMRTPLRMALHLGVGANEQVDSQEDGAHAEQTEGVDGRGARLVVGSSRLMSSLGAKRPRPPLTIRTAASP